MEKGSGGSDGHGDREEDMWDSGESWNDDVIYMVSERDNTDCEGSYLEEVVNKSRRSTKKTSEVNTTCGRGTNWVVTQACEGITERIEKEINKNEEDKIVKPPRRLRG